MEVGGDRPEAAVLRYSVCPNMLAKGSQTYDIAAMRGSTNEGRALTPSR